MQVLLFTVLQGLFSTVGSVALGFGMAWCLSYSPGVLARCLQRVLALPLLAPSIVGILGYITLFSKEGLLGGLFPIYGMAGIVVAHIFFYTPFVALFLAQAWSHVPHEQILLSHQLGLSAFQRLWLIEWPIMKPYLCTIGWLIFSMSIGSFTTVLILGGGPLSTTLPVALYQSLFHTLDFPRAITFALLQIGICVLTYSAMLLIPEKQKPLPSSHIHSQPFSHLTGALMALGLSATLLAPLAIVFIGSLQHIPSLLSTDILASMKKSFLIAICVGPLTTIIALLFLIFSAKTIRFLSLLGSTLLIVPLSLVGFGFFWIQLHWDNIPNFLVIVVINVLLTLPFAVHFLKDPALQIKATYKNLAQGLGMKRLQRTRYILLPLLKRPIGQSLGFCSALAAGDLTALLMFADYESPGLSSLLYQQLGGYRSGEAMATGLLLLILCWTLMSGFALAFKERKHA